MHGGQNSFTQGNTHEGIFRTSQEFEKLMDHICKLYNHVLTPAINLDNILSMTNTEICCVQQSYSILAIFILVSLFNILYKLFAEFLSG